MAMGARIAMPTDADAILTLTQWLSPAYPVGAFSYSHGLEAAVAAGRVCDATELEAWITDVLAHGAGRSDAICLAAAYKADTGADVGRIDAICRAFATAKERRLETEAQGTAFAQATAVLWSLDLPPLCYPVAVGRAAGLCVLPLELTASMSLQAFVSNLAAAGMRLLLVGQTTGQRLIKALAPLCLRLARDSAHGDLEQLSGTAFLAEIAAMRHETQHSRIFRT